MNCLKLCATAIPICDEAECIELLEQMELATQKMVRLMDELPPEIAHE
jgi:hypothetical protein